MNRFETITKTRPLTWAMALLIAALITGCGGGGEGDVNSLVATPTSAKAVTAFALGGVSGTPNEAAKTIAVVMPFGTNVTALVATFEATGASVKVGATTQVSGTTPNNFTTPVTYTITATDGTTTTYAVAVTVASITAKTVTAFSLGGVAGTTNEAGKSIAVTMPAGTNVTALVASFTTTGASVKVGTTTQVSGTTPNNFTTPVAYTVAAADGTTTTYNVTVSVASATAKAVTAFSLGGVSGTINEAAKTIAVAMPFGTDVTALIATYISTGASVKVGATTQVSGTTPNNFTAPVAYTVTAADATTATYNVAVSLATNTAKAVTAYSLAGVPGTINEAAKTIAVAMPSGTNVTALIATFTTTGASVKVGATTQVSAATANNFTVSPLAYTVTATDNSTAIYNVTVTVATAGPAPVPLGTAGNFVILTKSGITDVPASVITGNIGTSPISGAAIAGVTCPEVTGTIYSVDAAGPACRVTDGTLLTTAVSNMETAYTDAAGRPAGVGPNLNIGGGTVANQTLAAGTYTWGTNVTITTDLNLTGSATDVWIFQITGTLDMASNKQVILSGGALAKNIVWQVADTVTLGAGSHFEGVILAQTKVAMITGASINGRLLAQTEVTLQQNTVAQPAP